MPNYGPWTNGPLGFVLALLGLFILIGSYVWFHTVTPRQLAICVGLALASRLC